LSFCFNSLRNDFHAEFVGHDNHRFAQRKLAFIRINVRYE
jgi:hypothetical protein